MPVAHADKASLRQRLKTVRAALALPQRQAAAVRLANPTQEGPDRVVVSPAHVVSGYLPIGDELDPRPLMAAMASRGGRLCLPVMQGRDQPLLFRAWAPEDPLDIKAWGIREPTADRAAMTPELMLVPLLAVDRSGNRLGYGAGFYDRTIRSFRAAGHPIITLGLAFDEQIIDAVPHSDYDVPLDFVLTPSGLIRCQVQPERSSETTDPRWPPT